MDSNEAEIVRKKHLYRRLIMAGKIRLPPGSAARLIGPDCAYHLYSQFGGAGEAESHTPEKAEKHH